MLRRRLWIAVAAVCLGMASPGLTETPNPAPGDALASTAEAEALQVLDAFMAAFNARDMDAWTATLHFPHVRIASGAARVDADAASYSAGLDFERFSETTGWHHSAWTSRNVVQSGADKVHVAVRFARYREDDSLIAEYASLYIVERRDGRWGVVARSSFAP